MSEYPHHDPRAHLTYQVSVGHAKVFVTGLTAREAIESARRRLCAEMPRLWDVIHSLDPKQFEVRPA